MVTEPHDIEYQTMTAVGKALVTDDSTAILLGLLGYSGTKLWNTAVWYTREEWKATGKIPSYAKLDLTMKQERPLWYRRLHSQSAQAVLEELWQSYKSWFAHRKNGNQNASPPGFRRKDTLSAVTFKQHAVKWDPRTSTVRLSIPKDIYGKQFLYIKTHIPFGFRLTNDDIQISRLVYVKGEWYIHLVHKVALPGLKGAGETMSIDLGMANLAATACTDGTTSLWAGRELLAMERYFEKQKSKTTRSTSRKTRSLNRKRSRQRIHQLHSFTKSLVCDAEARGVSTIIVGTLKDIRDGKNWGDSGNQKLHKWPFEIIVKMLEYKARFKGIKVVSISESYTSQTCCICDTVSKSSRVHRGLYVCKHCGVIMHADVNGAINILKRYLPDPIRASWSSGCLAQPAVNRFAWRNTRPSVIAHEPGTWQTSLPHPRTESAPALSSCSA
jgi:putative transposase